jgi:hypothetical protein
VELILLGTFPSTWIFSTTLSRSCPTRLRNLLKNLMVHLSGPGSYLLPNKIKKLFKEFYGPSYLFEKYISLLIKEILVFVLSDQLWEVREEL